MIEPQHLILLGALVLSACGGRSGVVGASDTLFIALVTDHAADTDAGVWGARLAIEHLNADRLDGSRPVGIQVVQRDVRIGVAEAVLGVAGDDAVIGVVSQVDPSDEQSFEPLAEQRTIAVISSVGTDPGFNAPSPWLFRLPPADDEIALALATFVSDELGRRRVAVIYSNDRFGRYLTQQFTHEFAATGGEVAERAPFLPGVTEYRAYALRLAQGGARALVFVGDANEADAMVRALRQAGSTIPVVVGGGLGSDEAIDLPSSVRRITFYELGAVGTEYELRFADSYLIYF